jgi:glycine cleavage system H lipoate-binding protein
MSEQNKNNIWPEGESACIWMEAGIIDFKLCDHNHECETCSFDAIMKNERSFARHQNKEASSNTLPHKNPLQRLKELQWDSTSYYGNRYWYIEPLGKNKALIGLSELAMQVVPTVKDIILTEDGQVEKNQAVGWLVTDNGTICLNAPFDATIQKTNPALVADMSKRDKKAWLFTVYKENLSEELSKLKKGESAEAFLNTRREKILDIFESEMTSMSAGVGETMQDGGVLVSNLEQMIGSKRYFKIICEFFQNCITLPD